MEAFRDRVRQGARLIGSFIRTPAPALVEVMGAAGLDFVMADTEHAPIGPESLDGLALAARAAGLPFLARSATGDPAAISPLMDLGCAGVMVPHVSSAADATRVVNAVKYAPGQRGYSPSGRAGSYGTVDGAAYRAAADAASVVIVQIEDAGALGRLDEIAAVPGVDLLFIGPSDLSLSLGCAIDAPMMAAAMDAVADAARRHGIAAGIYVTSPALIAPRAAQGISFFICGSEQSMILNAGRALMQAGRARG